MRQRRVVRSSWIKGDAVSTRRKEEEEAMLWLMELSLPSPRPPALRGMSIENAFYRGHII
jgi:hypothetical protein